MLGGKTVIVLGAGSSIDFGLPVGSDLATDIRERLTFEIDLGQVQKGDALIASQLHSRFGNGQIGSYMEAAARVARVLGSFDSIDDCLYTHAHDERMVLLGKMAIVRAISLAEHGSGLRALFHGNPNYVAGALALVRKSWVGNLVRMVCRGVRHADRIATFKDLAIINFNYDRCAEVALAYEVAEAYGVEVSDSAEILRTLKVYRPYGSIGAVNLPGTQRGTVFGPTQMDYIEAASRISIYTEELGERPDLVQMNDTLNSAERIIFLGFGFHLQNMALLKSSSTSPLTVVGTVKKEPAARIATFRTRLYNTFGNIVTDDLEGSDCSTLLHHHGAQLSG